MIKLETKIPELDKLLTGGVPIGKNILFLSTPGIDTAAFAQQILFSRLEQGDSGLYLVFNKSPRAIRFIMKDFLWEIEEYEKKNNLTFIDGFSSIMNIKSLEKYSCNPKKPEEIKKVFKETLKKLKGNKIIIIDEVSNLFDLIGEEKTISLLKELKTSDSVLICLFTNWLYPEKTINKLKKHFDKTIEMKSVEERVILTNYFYIEGKAIPFKIAKPGGINVYVPKILVTGPYHAGKSTVVRQLSERSISIDRLGTTIALDHGYIEHGGFACDLFGTPGQERFDFILSILAKDVFGVLLVVDSTLPESFTRAKNMLSKVKGYGIPYVIIANKQDLPEALSIEEIRKNIGINEVPIIPAVATKGTGLKEALEKLFDLIMGIKGDDNGKKRST